MSRLGKKRIHLSWLEAVYTVNASTMRFFPWANGDVSRNQLNLDKATGVSQQ